MTRPDAIAAEFSDFKLVRTRKVAQFVFEVPIEQADQGLAVLGGTAGIGSAWVGIARIAPESGAEAPHTGEADPPATTLPEKKEGRSRALSRAQRAALACKDRIFWEFVRETWGVIIDTEDGAREWLCEHLGIDSRSKLDDPLESDAREKWDWLLNTFDVWTGRRAGPDDR